MPLWDSPPHRVTVFSVASGTDAGGGTTLTYSSLQAAVPCIINTSSSSERELYAQQGVVVTHTVSFLKSAVTTTFARGMKLVADDTGASYHVKGIRNGRAMGSVPAFLYLDCEEIL
jgi:hypothetical protein